MENQINDALGLKQETESRTSTPASSKSKSAATLRIVGVAVLIMGIFGGVIMCLLTMYVDSGKYTYTEDVVFNPMCFAYLFSIAFPSVITWAFAKAIADIVDNTSK